MSRGVGYGFISSVLSAKQCRLPLFRERKREKKENKKAPRREEVAEQKWVMSELAE